MDNINESVVFKNEKEALEMILSLVVRDNDVIKYLTQYESPQREEKALEAL